MRIVIGPSDRAAGAVPPQASTIKPEAPAAAPRREPQAPRDEASFEDSAPSTQPQPTLGELSQSLRRLDLERESSRRALAEMVSAMGPEAQGPALGSIFETGAARAFERAAAAAPDAVMPLSSFLKGLNKVDPRSEPIEQALALALSKLTPEAQGPGLGELFKRGWAGCFNRACTSAAPEARVPLFAAFEHGLSKQDPRADKCKRAVTQAVSRMAPEEQSIALGMLFERGWCDNFDRARSAAAPEVFIGSTSFERGLRKLEPRHLYVKLAIQHAVRAMPPEAQSQALGQLFRRGWASTFSTAIRSAHPDAAISLADFAKGLGYVQATALHVQEAIAKAVSTMAGDDQEHALALIAKRGWSNTYARALKACAREALE